MYETSNDLAPATRRSAVEMLNEHLADAIDLHLQAKQAHWNIKGPNFVGLHELALAREAARRGSRRKATVHERFAEDLLLHAQSEEEVLYPAAILVGDIIQGADAQLLLPRFFMRPRGPHPQHESGTEPAMSKT